MSQIKVLVAGDIHIGRVSSRVASNDLDELSARGAWGRIVDLAIAESVDLLCLTGDVTDESNRFWEALGPLERGLRKLEECGIMTLAVSGNHDYDALPRLADQLESDTFKLLGRNGVWERFSFPSADDPKLHFDGWSFPRERVRTSPVESYDLSNDPAVPTLAMVHGDLNVADSPYAPLSRQLMLSKSVAGWLLGHIHAPMRDVPDDQQFIVYPGSPQAMDPGETGSHGAVLVTFEHGRRTAIRPIPLSTVRYDSINIDASGIDDLGDLTAKIREEMEAFADQAANEGEDRLKHLVLRLSIRGQTAVAQALREEAEQIRDDLRLDLSGVQCIIDKVKLHVLPPMDLESLARSNSPKGTLAATLLELRQETPVDQLSDRSKRLIEDVRIAVASQQRLPVYSGIGETAVDPDQAVRDLACEQVERLLAQLQAQEPA